MERALAWLRRPIDEIRADPALRAYGAVLALLHVLTAYWARQGKIRWYLAPEQDAICWPLLPDCEWLRVFSVAQLETLSVLWPLAAVAVALAFLRPRWTGRAWLGLALLVAFELFLLSLDFRLRRNQHSMALWVTGAFLFVPGRRLALPLLVCLFYFWSGTLKLNVEWLSGAALYRPIWPFSGRMLVAACAYAALLELVLVWGLFARRPLVFWGTLAQLGLFHVLSWQVVGYFYPILMFGILAVFPLVRLLPGPAPGRGGPLALAALFSAFQLSPHLFPGDRTLTGEGRLFGLHMFDARVVCEAWGELHRADGSVTRVDLLRHGEARIACDPILVHGFARNLCRDRAAGRLAFERLAVRLRSRRTSATELRTVIDEPSFCDPLPRYRPFRHNPWIRTE